MKYKQKGLQELVEEGENVEYKSGINGFPTSIWETYSAFANTNGGSIILGIEEEEDGTPVASNITLKQAKKYKKEFWTNINNKQLISKNILSNDHFKILDISKNDEARYVILIEVKRAEITDRPIFLKGNPFGNTYKRYNDGDFKCSEEEVRRLIADSNIGTSSHDSKVLNGYTIDDIDLESLHQYRNTFTSVKIDRPWSKLDDLTFLIKLGGYQIEKNTEHKNEGVTLAGMIMFGKTESLLRLIPHFFLDFREYLNSNPTNRWTDRVCSDDTWETNLFQFYLKVFPKLISTIAIPFKLQNSIRVDYTTTHVALREAFINTLVHADYSTPGHIVIIKNKENFIFTNPGTLLISTDEFYKGGTSLCRNPLLQKMFSLIGLAEKAGSGAGIIMQGWKDLGWKLPEISELLRPDRVILTMPLTSFLPTEIETELLKIFGNNLKKQSDEKLLILTECISNTHRTHKHFKRIIEGHGSDISKILKQLCNDKFISSVGNGPATRYALNYDYSNNFKFDIITDNNNRSLSYKELSSRIMSIATDFMSLSEIATKTEKNNNYLRSRIIPRMIEEGKLERLYPDISRHSNQRYKAIKR